MLGEGNQWQRLFVFIKQTAVDQGQGMLYEFSFP
jgi:hypothetical protein